MKQYVIAKDFWDDETNAYTVRKFWSREQQKYVSLREATRYDAKDDSILLPNEEYVEDDQ